MPTPPPHSKNAQMLPLKATKHECPGGGYTNLTQGVGWALNAKLSPPIWTLRQGQWCDFRFKGWECDFRTHEAIPYRMLQVSSLCVPSGAIFVLGAGSAIFGLLRRFPTMVLFGLTDL